MFQDISDDELSSDSDSEPRRVHFPQHSSPSRPLVSAEVGVTFADDEMGSGDSRRNKLQRSLVRQYWTDTIQGTQTDNLHRSNLLQSQWYVGSALYLDLHVGN